MYVDSRMYRRHKENIIEYAWEESYKKGFREGFRIAGLYIAARMKNLGYPISRIAEITELTIEEVEQL